ncbi:hypothetical protein SPI_05644 [Niveomyces insectorum RCEF 264]|uniref:Uncharacterized protein n=1 Tax=Niveomyces insectorum RCEF 264 TaxID=1081102 RepID=A0A167TEC1_9HYPO|nr:hypothetical protein SPI_05644 [Niveomyces insectorum RCEF 264]
MDNSRPADSSKTAGDVKEREGQQNSEAAGGSGEADYAEFDPHAGPQVVDVVGGAPPLPLASGGRNEIGWIGGETNNYEERSDIGRSGDNADGDENTGRFDKSQGSPLPAARKNWLARLGRWARRKPYFAAAAVSLAVGVLALIILPVVLHALSINGDLKQDVVCHELFVLQRNRYVEPADPQWNYDSKWTTNVSYMGVDGSGGASWPYKLYASPSAAACCTMCFADFPLGCQGWAFLPWDDTPVPCTVVYGWNASDGVSTACPNGKAMMIFSSDTSHAGSVGGAGPCGL